MKYLVIGSGGREHAIAWRLLQDGSAREVYIAPGNGGTDPQFRADIAADDFEGIAAFCAAKKIDMVIVGPEAPLAGGIVDFLEKRKIPAFGPTQKATRLEASKLFAKRIMEKYRVPTAHHLDFSGRLPLLEYVNNQADFPLVIKLDGLAAGKGVGIPETRKEAVDFINTMVADDAGVFVEDFITGEEASVLCISDGTNIVPFVAAQDHKRIYDGDRGPNTGGMGAYAPAPVITAEKLAQVCDRILKPTIDGMRNEGIPFRGILYAGLMVSGDEIRVLEYNVRLGDPETQVILPLMNGRLGDLFQAAMSGTLDRAGLSFKKDLHAITVVIASGGYPGDYSKGVLISGLDDIDGDIIVFHAGTKRINDSYYTNGGRVLNVTAMGGSLRDAKDKVYQVIDKISFKGAYYRKDIGKRALT
jgi:phosphoribosylamine--glycine ligase